MNEMEQSNVTTDAVHRTQNRQTDRIQILTTLNETYLPRLQVLLTSIRASQPEETADIWLMHSGIRREALDPVARQCGGMGYGFHPLMIDGAAFDDAHRPAYSVAHLARVRDLDADVERHFSRWHALAVYAPRDVEVAPRFEHRLRHGRNIYRKANGLRSARKREARETKQKRRRGGKFTSALHATRLLSKGTDTPLL